MTYNDIRNKINAGVYSVPEDITKKAFPGNYDLPDTRSKSEKFQARMEYDNAQYELERKLQRDLAEASNLPEAVANKVWGMAWDQGHAHGYSEVVNDYEELADFAIVVVELERDRCSDIAEFYGANLSFKNVTSTFACCAAAREIVTGKRTLHAYDYSEADDAAYQRAKEAYMRK